MRQGIERRLSALEKESESIGRMVPPFEEWELVTDAEGRAALSWPGREPDPRPFRFVAPGEV